MKEEKREDWKEEKSENFLLTNKQFRGLLNLQAFQVCLTSSSSMKYNQQANDL